MKIAKNTFVLSVIASLLIGFTGGIAFTNYNDAGAARLSSTDTIQIPADVQATFDGAAQAASVAAAKAIYADIQKNGGTPSTTPSTTSAPQAIYNAVFEKAIAAPSPSASSSASTTCDSIYSKDAQNAYDSEFSDYYYATGNAYCLKFQGSRRVSYMVHEGRESALGNNVVVVDMDVMFRGTMTWLETDALGRCHTKSKSLNMTKHWTTALAADGAYYAIDNPCNVQGIPGHPFCGYDDGWQVTITKYLCSGNFTDTVNTGSIDITKCAKCKQGTSSPSASSTGTGSPGYR